MTIVYSQWLRAAWEMYGLGSEVEAGPKDVAAGGSH